MAEQWLKFTAGIEVAQNLRCDSVTTKSTGKVISLADFSVVSVSKNTKLTTNSEVIFAFFIVSVVI